MKVAVSTAGNDLDSPLYQNFGRTPKFLLYESVDETFTVVDNNESVETGQGAGTKTAEAVARRGAQAVITGQCGPNALRVLEQAGLKVLNSNAATVREALVQFRFITGTRA